MKSIYNAIIAQLKSEIPAIKWIDLDEGQLNYHTERPNVAFPAVLISVDITHCTDILDTVQHCEARVSIRIVQNPSTSRTNATAPDEI
jgi:hypothetical protein